MKDSCPFVVHMTDKEGALARFSAPSAGCFGNPSTYAAEYTPIVRNKKKTSPCGNAFFDGCSLLRTTEYALWKKIIVYRGFPERVF